MKHIKGILMVLLTTLFVILPIHFFSVSAQSQITVWWPTDTSVLTNTQPFKGLLENYPLNAYQMFWQVDNGQLNLMSDNYADYPHKEASVNVSGWNWKANGPYTLQFIAKDNSSTVLASKTVTICVNGPCTATSSTVTAAPTAQPSATPTSPPVQQPSPTPATSNVSNSKNPLSVMQLYVDPNSGAKQQYNNWQYSQPQNAQQMLKIANQAQAQWFGEWNSNITADVNTYVSAAAAANSAPVLVAYNIPQRDCGGYSAGGSNSPSGYRSWISSFAQGINHRKAVVILEPDALANISCLSATDQQTRYDLISSAISTLKSQGASVYLDAGNPKWIAASDMSSRLQKAGIAQADGFSLNISNFITTADNSAYGTTLSGITGGKHFVIDTSRNGNGPTQDNQWCNPTGRALGVRPTTTTGSSLIDAYLWVKRPGESDGTCNGGPAAGQWWADYALGLAKNAAY